MPAEKPTTPIASVEHQNAPDSASHDAAEGSSSGKPPESTTKKKRRRRRSSGGVPGLRDMTPREGAAFVIGWPGPLPPRKPASEPEKPQGDQA
jgi:hypothetical protein